MHLLRSERLRSSLALFALTTLVQVALLASAARAAEPVKEQEKTILFIGDSITAGYGVKKEEGYPERIAELLNKNHKVKIINGGISGSVTADADRRVKWFLKAKPQILVLALGGNDGLKGTPIATIKKNLVSAIDLAKANGLKVLLAGIRVYTNFGEDYSKSLEQMYKDIAKEKSVEFYPFLLDGVALDRALNQTDMKHPNAKGHEIIAEKLAPRLEKML